MKRLIGVPISMLPKTKVNRRPKWWIGVLTLCVVIAVATLIAFAIQAGLDATVDLDPRALYDIFFALGVVGMTVGGLWESNGHLPTFHPLYHDGQQVCTIVNILFYTIVILVWLKYHGDDRLKK